MSERALATTQKQAATRVTPSISGLLQRKCACGNHTVAGGECEACKDKSGMLQRASLSPRGRGTEGEGQVPPIVNEVLRSPGQPLDPATRAFFEPRFAHDFSGVRVHTDARAAESARAVNALAYTVGRDVVFGKDQHLPQTTEGTKLLAHELTHVVQQAGGGHGSNLSKESAETEARSAADGHGRIPVTGQRTREIARAPGPPPVKQSNLTPEQAQLLQKARATLKPKKGSIVGVLITDDGRQFDLESGGGQGFSSHIEGKATAKMNELGVKKATLLSELEPCQLCDRSDYPATTGPETPLKSTATGKELPRQTPKINSALPIDSELHVVGPESTATYRGTKSVSASGATRPATSPAVKVPEEGPKGGVQTREPVRAPVRTRVARSVRSVGGSLVKIAAVIIWNHLMTKLGQYIERKVTEYLIEQKMKAIEPAIAARLNDQVRVQADLQLRHPNNPIFGNISLLTTIVRCGDEDEICSLEVELTGVVISAQKIDPPKNEQSRVWIGFGGKPTTPPSGLQVMPAVPHDLTRTTFSVELTPLSNEEAVQEAELLKAEQLERQRREQRVKREAEEAEEKRKQTKLAQAREPQKAPPPSGPPLLPQPGAPAPKPESTPQNDPFNLGGRPQQKSPLKLAEDAADVAEALKSEFVQKADALRRNSASGDQLVMHRAEVEKWIAALRTVFAAWKAKGSPDWLPVKRLEYLVYWVDQPEGRTALMR